MTGSELSNRRVLLVEDEYLVAFYLADALRERGADIVGPASSLADAIALVRNEPDIDAGVLDVNLGGELVFPLADLLTERGVPFLFTSGYDASAFPERFRGLPMCLKPLDAESVASAVGQL